MRKKEPNYFAYYVLIIGAIALLSSIFLPDSKEPLEEGPCLTRYEC